MNILIFIFVGIFIGWIASILVQGSGSGPFGDMVIGIVGSFIGGLIFPMFSFASMGIGTSIVSSIIGAVVFLLIVRMISRGSGRPSH